jgi:iron complex transport system ATP-binding protein
MLQCVSLFYTDFQGIVELYGNDIRSYSPKERARRMAVLPAEHDIPFDFSVYDIVAMGRTPHIGLVPHVTEHDHQRICAALQSTATASFADRSIHDISSGERQRVFIAQALCQEPAVLVMDEPTAHLDLVHQKEIMDILKTLNKNNQLTIIMVSHDINLAAQYCSRIMLMKQGTIIADGEPAQIMRAETMNILYGEGVTVVTQAETKRCCVHVKN